jgi:hypothetical protein
MNTLKRTIYPACTNERKLPLNFDTLPPELRGAIKEKDQCAAVTCETIKNAYVSPYGVVFKNGRLIHESVYKMYPSWKNVLTFYKKILLGRVKTVSGPCLAAMNPFSSNYGHFLFESLPRIFAAKEFHNSLTLLIPEESPRHILSFAELFSFKDIVRVKQHELIHATEVMVPNSYQFGEHHYGLMRDLKTYLVESTRQNATIEGLRVLLSRDKAAYRKSARESELAQAMGHLGFERVFAEDLLIKEQIRVFANTVFLLGIHSTGLNNCLFMPDNSFLTNIILRGHNDNSVYNTSQVSKINFEFIVTERLHNHSLVNFDDPDLRVRDIANHVEKIFQANAL